MPVLSCFFLTRGQHYCHWKFRVYIQALKYAAADNSSHVRTRSPAARKTKCDRIAHHHSTDWYARARASSHKAHMEEQRFVCTRYICMPFFNSLLLQGWPTLSSAELPEYEHWRSNLTYFLVSQIKKQMDKEKLPSKTILATLLYAQRDADRLFYPSRKAFVFLLGPARPQ